MSDSEATGQAEEKPPRRAPQLRDPVLHGVEILGSILLLRTSRGVVQLRDGQIEAVMEAGRRAIAARLAA